MWPRSGAKCLPYPQQQQHIYLPGPELGIEMVSYVKLHERVTMSESLSFDGQLIFL